MLRHLLQRFHECGKSHQRRNMIDRLQHRWSSCNVVVAPTSPFSVFLFTWHFFHFSCFMFHVSLFQEKGLLITFSNFYASKGKKVFFLIGGNSDFFLFLLNNFSRFLWKGGVGFIPAWEFFFSSSIRSLEMKWPSWPHTTIISIISSASSGTQQKPNSGTYNFVEVSGHNLKSSQTEVCAWIS